MPKPETLLHKIMVGIIISLSTLIIGWGTWVTTKTFAIDELKNCVESNERKIEKESEKREKQITDRMDKQDKKLENIYKILIDMKGDIGKINTQ
jgi:hypothetical protein